MAQRGLQIDVHTERNAPSRPPLSPQEIAQRRTAEIGANVSLWVGGTTAAGLALVAFSYLALFVSGLAATWGEALRMIVLAAVYTVALTGLPTLAALLQHTYPEEARIIHSAWLSMVGLAFMAIMLYGLSAAPAGYDPRWQPRAILPNIDIASSAPVNQAAIRRLIMLMFSLGAAAGSGLMCRWAVLGSAESYRLAYGEARPAQAQQSAPQLDVAAMANGGDIFSLWAENRLRTPTHKPLQSIRVRSQHAYADYLEACELNGVQPLSDKKFYTLLAERAMQSQGRITSQKSNGVMYYQGWELPEDSKALQYAEYHQIGGPKA